MSSLLEAMAAGQRHVSELADPVHLRRAAERITAVAEARGATRLLAASSAGERVVGAALLMSPRLRALVCTEQNADASGEAVLVVDVNLASGTAIAHAARLARWAGARTVHGAVLHALPHAVGQRECGLDALEIA